MVSGTEFTEVPRGPVMVNVPRLACDELDEMIAVTGFEVMLTPLCAATLPAMKRSDRAPAPMRDFMYIYSYN